jgi:hypothetical protein
MNTEINELGALGEPVEDQVARRPGQHDLTAVRDPAQPGAALDRLTEVTPLVAPLSLCGVQGDAQLQRRFLRPSLGMNGTLHLQRGSHGIRCAGERRHNARRLVLLQPPHPAMP